ncbi:MAG: phospholipase D-like domain-containing protein [Cytophagales bacterium]
MASKRKPTNPSQLWALLFLACGILAGYFLPISQPTFLATQSEAEVSPLPEGDQPYVEVVFNPVCANLVIRELKKSKREVYSYLYSFSHTGIGDAFIEIKKRGVDVYCIIDEKEYKRGKAPQVDRLRAAGITVVLDPRSGLGHDKYTVIDGKKVLKGSFNYDEGSGVKSYNDTICYHNYKETVQAFTEDWLKNKAQIAAYKLRKKRNKK